MVDGSDVSRVRATRRTMRRPRTHWEREPGTDFVFVLCIMGGDRAGNAARLRFCRAPARAGRRAARRPERRTRRPRKKNPRRLMGDLGRLGDYGA
eukprot:213513-Prymnesium_polylepis.1